MEWKQIARNLALTVAGACMDLEGQSGGRIQSDQSERALIITRAPDPVTPVMTPFTTEAEGPSEIAREGWRNILRRIKDEGSEDQPSILAAGIIFYAMLATVAALAMVISIYGLVTDPHDVERQLAVTSGFIPDAARTLITGQLVEIASQPHAVLGFAAGACFLFGLGSAYSAVRTLMISLNLVYDVPERRGFVPLHASALLLTFSGIIGVMIDFTLITALPTILALLGLPRGLEITLSVLRWPLLAIVVMLGLAMLYRFAPSRKQPRWQWVSWGAAGATALWLIGSLLFTGYMAGFGEYNETYGVLGAVVITLMWSWLGIYAVLLGAELNAQMERQTTKDTTE
jgi:membrane protein